MKDMLTRLGIGSIGGSPSKMAERIAQEASIGAGTPDGM